MPQSDDGKDDLPAELVLAFRPLHKRAFGMAVGLTLGSFVAVVTIFAVLVPGRPGLLDLLANYYPGYSVTWNGVLVGFFWSVFAFSVAGWFAAFCRNFFIAASIWAARAQAELRATRDFLDHI